MIVDKRPNQFKVKMMKIVIQIILMALFILMASAVTVFADDDNEKDESSGSSGETEEKGETENQSIPGFEIPFAVAGALAASRLMKKTIETA